MSTMPIDKNTKRGFTDVNTPQENQGELLLRLVDQIKAEKKSLNQNRKRHIKAKDSGDYNKANNLVRYMLGSEKKLGRLNRELKKHDDSNRFLIDKLKECVSKEVFLDCAVRAQADYRAISSQIEGYFEDN